MDPLVREREPAGLDDPVAERDRPAVLDQDDRRGASDRDRVREVPDASLVERTPRARPSGDRCALISSSSPGPRPTRRGDERPELARLVLVELADSSYGSIVAAARPSGRRAGRAGGTCLEVPQAAAARGGSGSRSRPRRSRGRASEPGRSDGRPADALAGRSSRSEDSARSGRSNSSSDRTPRSRSAASCSSWASASLVSGARCPGVPPAPAGVPGGAADHRRAHQGPSSTYEHARPLLSPRCCTARSRSLPSPRGRHRPVGMNGDRRRGYAARRPRRGRRAPPSPAGRPPGGRASSSFEKIAWM